MKKHTPRFTSRLGRFPLTAVLLACAAGPLAAQTIANPGFETDTFTVWPGYVSGNSPITGWNGNPPGSYGLNPSGGSPFADNGAVPQGSQVAFIQGQNTEIDTTINGLTPGSRYRLSFRVNARFGEAGQRPVLRVSVDGLPLLQSQIWNVGGNNPYRYVDLAFEAGSASVPLMLENVAGGDTSVLVDDFSVTPAPNETWSSTAWNDDSDIGVNSAYDYSHAYSFNTSTSAFINDVTFVGVAGINPTVPTGVGAFAFAGYNASYPGDTNSIQGQGAGMATDFVYNGNPGVLTLRALKPNRKYLLSLYSVGWEPANNRWITFASGNERLTFDQDAFGDNAGNRISLVYTADADGNATINLIPLSDASFHIYGMSNREFALPVNEAPIAIVHPVGSRVVTGNTYTFSGAATGLPAPAYQWYLNDAPVTDTPLGVEPVIFSGAQTESLSVTPTGAAQAGLYTLKATNNLGTGTSKAAYLEVVQPKAGPLYSTGVDAAGAVLPLLDEEGNPLSPVSDPHYTLTVNPAGEANIQAIVESNIPGAWLPKDSGSQWVGPVANTEGVAGAVGAYTYKTSFEVGANLDTFSLSGFYAVDNVTDNILVNGQAVIGVPLSQGFGSPTWFSISKFNAPTLHTGTNTLEFVVTNQAPAGFTGLRVLSGGAPAGIKPVVMEQPAGGTIISGQPVTLSTRVYGSGDLAYQWTLNGNPIAGAIYSSYAIPSFSSAQAGTYAVKATNSLGSATSANAVLAITDVPPSLVSQPSDLLTAVGKTITLSVTAAGSAPFSYQWFKGDTAIPQATGSTYTINSAALTDTGSYLAKVTNAFGNVSSNPVTITVMDGVANVFSTGVDNTGAALPDASEDPHYQLIINANGDNDIPAVVHNSNIFPIVAGPWLADTAVSKWISPIPDSVSSGGLSHDGGEGPGTYVYRTTFNAAGFDPESIIISGRWSSDNLGLGIRVNDSATGITGDGNFGAYANFRIASDKASFISGVNTLDFVVQNGDAEAGYTGLRVDGLLVLGTRVPTTNLPPISISISAGGKPVISFQGTAGVTYPIQRSTTLTPANSWSVIGQPVAPAGGLVSFEDTSAPIGRAFYRVVFPQ